VAEVSAPDEWYLKAGLTPVALAPALLGRSFAAARRIGKLLLLDTAGGPTLGLRFGMTGRLLVDGSAGIDELIYASVRDETAWDRLVIGFADGGELRVRDPRRLGGVSWTPTNPASGSTLPT
jgi:formamidopyrimidine-DNA glycosylase